MTPINSPDFGPDSASLPPLPVIHSDAIRLQVFTHRSFFARPTHIFEDHPDDPSPDNEKYVDLSDGDLNHLILIPIWQI
jgi:ribonuclease-3